MTSPMNAARRAEGVPRTGRACAARCLFVASVLAAVCGGVCGATLKVDDSPTRPGEWGFRPADGSSSETNPPAFAWRPQRGAKTYELVCARDKAFQDVSYRADGVAFNVHCPPRTFPTGQWFWRYRFRDARGTTSPWSVTRSFTLPGSAVPFPLPVRSELLSRIPTSHPRLFVRPEQLPRLRELARGELRDTYAALVRECDQLLKRPPPPAEPAKYPKGMTRGSDEWRDLWWGNRTYTQRILNAAATLAFTRMLGGKEEYGQLAKKLLLVAAEWDPRGATGYRYNDEAGMPYAYYFSRTYTFLHDLLTEKEREKCRQVMRIRGEEMYRHLCPRHLWRPYSSHSNRAWHFLGEVGVAFHGEIPGADEWVWFAMNVFANVYPVWSDADGGWHEGTSYWRSYVGRFTWWADVMRAAFGIDAYRKPYFSRVGFYPMYLQPPGTRGGGFGDLTARNTSRSNRDLMTVLAAQARNPYWQWYVDINGGPARDRGYIGFVRGALPQVTARPPADLLSSRCFRGTGQAMLNRNLLDAKGNVGIVFKSSPFGTQSHGYEANNSFLLYAFGERLLIRTGRRDSYGSKHHQQWMWHTKSTNCITVDGEGQRKHSDSARGRIVAFHTSDDFDFVSGEAGEAYEGRLKTFRRHILFVKPDLIVLYDRLEAPKAATFEWRLHAPTEMKLSGQRDIRVVNGKAACKVSFLAPDGLKLSMTDKFDTPPRPRIRLTEWHLTAGTPRPAGSVQFVTVLRPHRTTDDAPGGAKLEDVPGGKMLTAEVGGRRVVVLLAEKPGGEVASATLRAKADVAAFKLDAAGKPTGAVFIDGQTVRTYP